jgi:hypothetical protein
MISTIKSCCKGKKSCETTEKKSSQCASFPEKELKKWLKGRIEWNHNDWLNLLENLRKEGYSNLTDNDAGRTQIGQFLETERKH